MTWRKLFRRGLSAFLIAIFLTSAGVVCAAIEIFDGTGQYIMSDFENPDIAKQRARQRAEQDLQKKVVVYLQEYSREINVVLTDEEISAVASNETDIIDKMHFSQKPATVDGKPVIIWTATLKANINSDVIPDWFKRHPLEKIIILQQSNNLHEAIKNNFALAEKLTTQYKSANTQVERNRIRQQINQIDKDFLAVQKLTESNKLAYREDSEAIKFCNEALKLNPNLAEAYNSRGIVHVRLRENDQAILDFDKAVELKPNDATFYFNRGVFYTNDLEQHERAIEDFDKALELKADYAEAYCARGNAYSDLGQYERALQDYNKAIELKPDFDWAYSNRGIAYGELEDYQQAVQDFDKTIELNPNPEWVYLLRGIVYFELEDYRQAIKDFDQALEFKPDYADVYQMRGYVYCLLEDYRQAIKDFDKVIELNPNVADVYHTRGICYKELGDEAKAQADFDKAKELGYSD